jgi:YaiO family outer membrane protein
MLLPAAAVAQELSPTTVPTLDAAILLADEGRNDEALRAFRQRAAADPSEHVARIWIARLHERMGHSDVAEPIYRSVLLEDPSNVEAMLGVAAILLKKGEPDEATEILEVATERAPESPDLFLLLGRAHRLAGRDIRAIESLERAVTISPSDDIYSELERARLSYMHRVGTQGFTEQFNGTTPDSRNGEVMINYRVSDKLRVVGRGGVQRKFGVSEQRGGGGLEWRWTPRTTLRGQVLVGANNLVMPEGDYAGAVDYTYGPAIWSASMRHFDFTGARTTVLSPAVGWVVSPRLLVDLRYAVSWTETNAITGVTAGHSAQFTGDYRLHRHAWLRLGYAAGIDNFDNFSIDMIGDFRANTMAVGVRVPLVTLTTIGANYERQWRRDDVEIGRVTISLQQQF